MKKKPAYRAPVYPVKTTPTDPSKVPLTDVPAELKEQVLSSVEPPFSASSPPRSDSGQFQPTNSSPARPAEVLKPVYEQTPAASKPEPGPVTTTKEPAMAPDEAKTADQADKETATKTDKLKEVTKPVATTGEAAPVTIAVNISMPKLHRPKMPAITLPKLPYKRLGMIVGALAVVVIVGWTAFHLIDQARIRHKQYEAAHAAAEAQLPKYSKPNFTPVVPASEPNLATVGKNAAFDGTKDTYSFNDTLDGLQLTVSQQPVPASFSSPKAAVAAVAKSVQATTAINSKAGTAYMGTNEQSNAQVIVFSVNDLLIFINSPFTHSVGDWISYLNQLT